MESSEVVAEYSLEALGKNCFVMYPVIQVIIAAAFTILRSRLAIRSAR